MSSIALGLDAEIEIDEQGFISFKVDEENFVFHINEIVAAVHDDPTGKKADIMISAMACQYDEAKLFSKLAEDRYYVQSEMYTGIVTDGSDSDVTFDTVNIVGTNRTIELVVDEVPYVDAGDEVLFCEKWNLKLTATKRMRGDFFLSMAKAQNIDLENVTREDLDKLVSTTYFTKRTSTRIQVELEGSAIHFKGC